MEKKIQLYFNSIKMSEQTLKSGDIMVKKKEFHASKQAIALNLVDTNKIVVSDKFKHSDDGSKYFIGYLHDDDGIRLLCILLPQMNGYIKYFDNRGKKCFLKLNMKVYILNILKSGTILKSR